MSSGWCCAPGSITTPFWNRGRSQQPTRTRRSFVWRSCVRSLWRLCSRSSKNTPTPKVCAVCVCLFLIYWMFYKSSCSCLEENANLQMWSKEKACFSVEVLITCSYYLSLQEVQWDYWSVFSNPPPSTFSPLKLSVPSHFLRTVMFYILSSLDCDRYAFSALPICVLFLFWCPLVFLFHIRYVIWGDRYCFTQRWFL